MIIRIMVLLACAALAACSPSTGARSAPTSTPRTSRSLPPAPPEAVAWAKRFCTIVNDVQQGVWKTPTGHDADTPDELRQWFSEHYASARNALAKGTRSLVELGPVSVAGGDAATRKLIDKFDAARQLAEDGKARMDALPAGSTEADIGGIEQSTWPKIVRASANPFDGVEISDEMLAADTAHTCSAINSWPR
jgi:hypothetical protein